MAIVLRATRAQPAIDRRRRGVLFLPSLRKCDFLVVAWLLNKAREESNSGARPLRRAIQRYIEDELSEFMIRNKDTVPERIEFTMNGDEVVLIAAPKDVDLIAN